MRPTATIMGTGDMRDLTDMLLPGKGTLARAAAGGALGLLVVHWVAWGHASGVMADCLRAFDASGLACCAGKRAEALGAVNAAWWHLATPLALAGAACRRRQRRGGLPRRAPARAGDLQEPRGAILAGAALGAAPALCLACIVAVAVAAPYHLGPGSLRAAAAAADAVSDAVSGAYWASARWAGAVGGVVFSIPTHPSVQPDGCARGAMAYGGS